MRILSSVWRLTARCTEENTHCPEFVGGGPFGSESIAIADLTLYTLNIAARTISSLHPTYERILACSLRMVSDRILPFDSRSRRLRLESGSGSCRSVAVSARDVFL